MSGWFSVKRGMLDHDLFKPDGKWSKAEAWIWMIENAAFRDATIDVGGKPHVVSRGSLCFSERFMADKFGWSQKALRNFLDKLEAHGAIIQSVAKTGQGTKSKRKQVTLCNYDKYQSPEIKTKAKRKQNGSKEEQETNTPPSEGASAPDLKSVDIDPINKAVWDFGVPFLSSLGVKNPRPIIGGWLRDHPAPLAVLEALRDAQKAATQDPVPYVKAILKGGKAQARQKWTEGSLRTLSPTRVQAFWGGHWENTNDYTADEAERHRLFVGRAPAYANA